VGNHSCTWRDEQCDRRALSLGLCRRHGQLARRRGVIGSYRRVLPPCEECGRSLPDGSRTTRRFCSTRCVNVQTWRENKEARLQRHRDWRNANRDRHAAERLGAKIGRRCVECDEELPPTSHRDRRFCSRRCINARSLRERSAERRESAVRRRGRLLAAKVPGVSARDWQRLVGRHGGCCAYCGEKAPMTQDHIIPLSRGGWHAIGNLLPACRRCNSAKRDDLLVYWRLRHPSARLSARRGQASEPRRTVRQDTQSRHGSST